MTAKMTKPGTPAPFSADQADNPVSWEPSAAFFKYTVGVLLAGALVFMLVIRLTAPDQVTRNVGPIAAMIVSVASWYLYSRGRLRAAVSVLAVGAWLTVTAISTFNGGVRTPVIVAYPVVIILIGWLIGVRWALAAATLTVAVTIGFVALETDGLLPTAPPTSALMHGVVQVLLVGLAAIVINFLVRSYQNRLDELHLVGSNLEQRSDELETSRAELQRAQAVAKVGSWVYDMGTDTMRLSVETCRIFGLPEGTTGRRQTYLERTYRADRAVVELAWQAALDGGEFDIEHRIRVGSALRWIRQRAELEFAGDGKPWRAVGITQDITERKQVEAAVLAARNRLQATLDALPDLLFEVDLDGRIHDYHSHRNNLLAAPPEVFLGKRLSDVIPGDAAAVCLSALDEAVRLGWSTGAQYSLQLPEGWRWFELSVARMRENGANERHFIVIARDITERKETEDKLRLSSNVFTHTREGIMITGADGTILDVNESFSRITGYGREDVLGRNPRILNSGRHDDAFYASLWGDLASVGHWYGEVWNRRKSGEVYVEMQTVSAVRDAEGNTLQYVALFSDITAQKKHQAQLEHIAHYDALTGLPNRVLLADRLQQAMAQTQRRGKSLAVTYLDLDGFKSINDRHGHATGDKTLVALAERLKLALREGDTLARIGGDEFVAVLVDLNVNEAPASQLLLSRLLAAAAQPFEIDDCRLQISASLGITFYPQAQDIDADQLLRQADQAMYQAKLAGKNRCHVFDAEQDRSLRGHHESLEGIHEALLASEFVLYYQPKVNMRTGAVIGAEALIRWQHPQHGLLPPAKFLSVIEDHPLAIQIGEWVIDQALAQVGLWRAAGLDLPVSVNIGARQLQQTNFVPRLRELLAAHPQVDPSRLELEVLETSALADVVQASRVIDACREFGVMFALDDFGTGYSSLTYLKRLPVALLKIDQSFVFGMLDDPDDLAILDGVIGLARAFRRQVLAEGVETVAHGEMLLCLGCELAQGYGISRPMPGEQLPEWAARWRGNPAWANLAAVSRDDLPLLFSGAEQRAEIIALEKHVRDGGETPPSLHHHQTRFGAWLQADGLARHGTRPAFRAVAQLYQKIHALGSELCQMMAQDQQSEACDRLGELYPLRDSILTQLQALVIERRG